MKKKTVEIPIYHGTLTFYKDKTLKRVAKKHGFKDIENFGACAFIHHKNGYTRYFIAFGRERTPWTIAHEAKHIVNRIFEDRGIELSLSHDEPECYLLGWVVKQATKFLKK